MKQHCLTFSFIACLFSPISFAQYADEETCAVLSELRLPELESELASDAAVETYIQSVSSLNPDLATKLPVFPNGGLYLVLAECYQGGIGVEKDSIASKSLLRVAAAKGNSQAEHMVASIDLFQSDDPERQRRGFAVLERQYEDDGSAYAAGKLGWAYQKGVGVKPDLREALTHYHYAAERGMTYWQYLLAHAYEKGYLGLEVDEERARYWREYKPKVHVALYDCWVSYYYEDGIFPKSEELARRHQDLCNQTDVATFWE